MFLSSCSAPLSFSLRDLPKIAPRESELPGLVLSSEHSGIESSDDILRQVARFEEDTSTLDVRALRRENHGLMGGYTAVYLPPNVVRHGGPLRFPGPIIEVTMTLFGDVEGAKKWFSDIGADLPESFGDVLEFRKPALVGIDSYAAIDPTLSSGRPGFWYLARRKGNLVIQFVVEGDLPMVEVAMIAYGIDTRARMLSDG
jgi:hypothetical protein